MLCGRSIPTCPVFCVRGPIGLEYVGLSAMRVRPGGPNGWLLWAGSPSMARVEVRCVLVRLLLFSRFPGVPAVRVGGRGFCCAPGALCKTLVLGPWVPLFSRNICVLFPLCFVPSLFCFVLRP